MTPDYDAASRPVRTAASMLTGPVRDESAIVFAFRDVEAIRMTAEGMRMDDAPARAVEKVCAYAQQSSARLEPLFGGTEIVCGGNWKLAVPGPDSPGGRLGLTYHLELPSRESRVELESELMDDSRIAYVHRPTIFYPLIAPQKVRHEKPGLQWALSQCEFHKGIWDQLEQGPDPGVIGIIDAGGETSHPELAGRLCYVPPTCGVGAPSSHAAEVAGVIAAIRGNGEEEGEGMAGCCSARVRVYDCWTPDAFDSKAFYRALDAVARDRLPVVNLSMGSCTSDATTECLIRRCLDLGVVVVAAMGDMAQCGSPPVFPAAHCGVIAVGGTTRGDGRTMTSSTGCHIWISAPGEDILTLSGDDEVAEADGTSYATAMVSAAVWLARRAKPGQTPADIRELLARSVDGKSVPPGTHSPELGYGRLNMKKLAELVSAHS